MGESSHASADANLLVAYALETDALHTRARHHMANVGRLRASSPAVLEAMTVIHRQRLRQGDFLAALADAFALDEPETFATAALALDKGILKTPFDAYHAADAHLRGLPLHTADDELLKSAFPTKPF